MMFFMIHSLQPRSIPDYFELSVKLMLRAVRRITPTCQGLTLADTKVYYADKVRYAPAMPKCHVINVYMGHCSKSSRILGLGNRWLRLAIYLHRALTMVYYTCDYLTPRVWSHLVIWMEHICKPGSVPVFWWRRGRQLLSWARYVEKVGGGPTLIWTKSRREKSTLPRGIEARFSCQPVRSLVTVMSKPRGLHYHNCCAHACIHVGMHVTGRFKG
jgi:hypothetical protein